MLVEVATASKTIVVPAKVVPVEVMTIKEAEAELQQPPHFINKALLDLLHLLLKYLSFAPPSPKRQLWAPGPAAMFHYVSRTPTSST